MRGRKAVDQELARAVEQRLERLLAERPPRRAYELDHDEPVEQLEEPDRPAPEVSAEVGRWPGFTRAHLAVIGVLVLIAVLLGGWAVLRAKPVPLPVVTAPRAEPASPVSVSTAGSQDNRPAATAAASRASPRIVVHVLGAVRRPGLVELPAAARVQDAIEAAGGLRSTARLGDLNLAQPLADGQQLVVGAGDRSVLRGGSQASAGSGARPGGSTGTGAAPGALVDLNAATVEQLDTLPGVGPVTAAKIVAWREEHGRFTRVEELQEVSGVGPKTYAEIAPHCRV